MSAPGEFVDDVMGRLERLEDVTEDELTALTVAQLREASHVVGGIGCSLADAYRKREMAETVVSYVHHYRVLAAEGRL
ncbi:hypothetical protein AAK967_00710 [Atopobiaceae bacterium 24-176]